MQCENVFPSLFAKACDFNFIRPLPFTYTFLLYIISSFSERNQATQRITLSLALHNLSHGYAFFIWYMFLILMYL